MANVSQSVQTNLDKLLDDLKNYPKGATFTIKNFFPPNVNLSSTGRQFSRLIKEHEIVGVVCTNAKVQPAKYMKSADVVEQRKPYIKDILYAYNIVDIDAEMKARGIHIYTIVDCNYGLTDSEIIYRQTYYIRDTNGISNPTTHEINIKSNNPYQESKAILMISCVQYGLEFIDIQRNSLAKFPIVIAMKYPSMAERFAGVRKDKSSNTNEYIPLVNDILAPFAPGKAKDLHTDIYIAALS